MFGAGAPGSSLSNRPPTGRGGSSFGGGRAKGSRYGHKTSLYGAGQPAGGRRPRVTQVRPSHSGNYNSSLPPGGFGSTPSTYLPSVPRHTPSGGWRPSSPRVRFKLGDGYDSSYSVGRSSGSTIGVRGSLVSAIGLVAVACLVTGVILLIIGAIPAPFIDLEIMLTGIGLIVIAPIALPLICCLFCCKVCCR